MWRDRWFAVGVIGAGRACLFCLTPLAVVGLGPIGLGDWVGPFGAVLLLALITDLAVVASRRRVARRRTS